MCNSNFKITQYKLKNYWHSLWQEHLGDELVLIQFIYFYWQTYHKKYKTECYVHFLLVNVCSIKKKNAPFIRVWLLHASVSPLHNLPNQIAIVTSVDKHGGSTVVLTRVKWCKPLEIPLAFYSFKMLPSDLTCYLVVTSVSFLHFPNNWFIIGLIYNWQLRGLGVRLFSSDYEVHVWFLGQAKIFLRFFIS